MHPQPLVCVVTPVYNGAEFFDECIQSVLDQTYSNWEYCIVDNCSTDQTLAIAERHAARDPRIRILRHREHVGIIQNHNRALRQVSPASKYFKLLFADDLLYPDCLEKMVGIAETHPTVGLVCACSLQGDQVVWGGLPPATNFVPGDELCRLRLLGNVPYVFGTGTSQMFRSDILRSAETLYDESNLHADHEFCFDVLQRADFGFVHEVLGYSRLRNESWSSFAESMNGIILGNLTVLLKYGPKYLDDAEYRLEMDCLLARYGMVLGKGLFCREPARIWRFHRKRREELGLRVGLWSFLCVFVRLLTWIVLHPRAALQRARRPNR